MSRRRGEVQEFVKLDSRAEMSIGQTVYGSRLALMAGETPPARQESLVAPPQLLRTVWTCDASFSPG